MARQRVTAIPALQEPILIPPSPYCPTRDSLEQRRLVLADRLFGLTTRLTKLIGNGHSDFLVAKAKCEEMRGCLTDSRRRIDKHRQSHGC